MADPKAQADAQLARILETTKRTVAAFAKEARAAKLEKHGALIAHYKQAHGLGHGDANRLAHAVREHLAGGPADEGDLLAAQYAGKKAALRPIFDELAAIARALGPDVTEVVQKTGVSFRRDKQFALVTVPSASRVRLGLNLEATPDDPRVKATTGMCKQAVDLSEASAVDDAVAGWIAASYARARR